MNDRDYLPIFPSWRLFFLFNLICYMGIYSMASTAISFIKKLPPEYVLTIPQVFVFLFMLACYWAFFGHIKGKFFLLIFNIFIILISITKIFFDQNKDFIWFSVSATLVSTIACFLIFSSWFESFIFYRLRHSLVMKKVENGEPLDDGSFFQLGKDRVAFTKNRSK